MKKLRHRLFTKCFRNCVLFLQFSHSQNFPILIRRPDKAIVSQYKTAANSKEKYDSLDESDIGFDDLYLLHKKLLERTEDEILIVDADQLLQNPTKIMKNYCERVGLGKWYSDDILCWSPTEIPEQWKVWKDWHVDVINSSGIEMVTPEMANRKQEELTEFIETKLPAKWRHFFFVN